MHVMSPGPPSSRALAPAVKPSLGVGTPDPVDSRAVSPGHILTNGVEKFCLLAFGHIWKHILSALSCGHIACLDALYSLGKMRGW